MTECPHSHAPAQAEPTMEEAKDDLQHMVQLLLQENIAPRAENERLRSALRAAESWIVDGGYCSADQGDYTDVLIANSAILVVRKIRAALIAAPAYNYAAELELVREARAQALEEASLWIYPDGPQEVWSDIDLALSEASSSIRSLIAAPAYNYAAELAALQADNERLREFIKTNRTRVLAEASVRLVHARDAKLDQVKAENERLQARIKELEDAMKEVKK